MRLMLAAAMALIPFASQAQEVNGVWRTQTSDTGAYLHVNIAPCGYDATNTCGVIAEAVKSTRDDLVGKPIIWDMVSGKPGRWSKGKIWAPDDDKTYRSNMALNGNILRVEGCVAVFCRGQNWTRVK